LYKFTQALLYDTKYLKETESHCSLVMQFTSAYIPRCCDIRRRVYDVVVIILRLSLSRWYQRLNSFSSSQYACLCASKCILLIWIGFESCITTARSSSATTALSQDILGAWQPKRRAQLMQWVLCPTQGPGTHSFPVGTKHEMARVSISPPLRIPSRSVRMDFGGHHGENIRDSRVSHRSATHR